MLTLSSKNTTEVAKAVTSPIILLYVGYVTPLYLATKGPVTWNSQTWQQTWIDINHISFDDAGDNRASVRVSPAWLSTLLAEDFADATVQIWQLWGDPTYAVGDGVSLFEGVGEDVRISRDYIDLELVQKGFKSAVSPRHLYAHENQLAAGTVITVGTTTITIERAPFLE